LQAFSTGLSSEIFGNRSQRGRARRPVGISKETANVVHLIQVAIQQHLADRMSAADTPYPAIRVQAGCASHSPMACIDADSLSLIAVCP
jgi:hypothetical protein